MLRSPMGRLSSATWRERYEKVYVAVWLDTSYYLACAGFRTKGKGRDRCACGGPGSQFGERRPWRFVIRHLVESCSGRHGAQAEPAPLVSPNHQQAQGICELALQGMPWLGL